MAELDPLGEDEQLSETPLLDEANAEAKTEAENAEAESQSESVESEDSAQVDNEQTTDDAPPVDCASCAALRDRLESLQTEHAAVVAERDELLVSAGGESEDSDTPGPRAKHVRLRKRFVAHGAFGTVFFRAHQIVSDPQTIKLLRKLGAPLGKV